MNHNKYKINKEGIELIKKSEGLELNGYLCPSGHWTIGYGHKNDETISVRTRITEQMAENLLLSDLEKVYACIINCVLIELTQNQFSALCGLIFNIGCSAFRESTLLKKINQCDIIGAADEFLKWNKITVRGVKVPLKGLSARREDERLLFLKEDSTIG